MDDADMVDRVDTVDDDRCAKWLATNPGLCGGKSHWCNAAVSAASACQRDAGVTQRPRIVASYLGRRVHGVRNAHDAHLRPDVPVTP